MPALCPLPAQLQTVTADNCPIDFGQIVRALLYRRYGYPTTAPFPPASGVPNIGTSTNLVSVLNGTTDAKGILTPLFSNLAFPETEPIIEGENDNTTVLGTGHVSGGNVIRLKSMFTSMSDAQAESLWALEGEKLDAIFFNQFGQGIMKKNGRGFAIYNQTMSDVTSEGLNRKNKTMFGFTLPYGWSRGYTVVNLSYNVLDLVQV